MGGPTPYEPLAAVFSPPLLGLVPATEPSLICRDAIPDAIPLGAMGAMGQGPEKVCWSGAVSMNAQGPWPPLGGERHSREGSAGGVVCPPYLFPTYVLPGWSPHIRGSS